MSDNIDTRVTPALHPENVKKIDGYGEDTAHLLAATETVFSEVYIAIGKIHDARVASKKNPSWTEAEQTMQTAAFADKQFARVARQFDRVLQDLNKGIASIEAELTAPVESRAAHPVSSEIRAYVKALPAGERMTFIQQAIRDSDQRTATAVLSAPAYLSGMDANMQGIMTRMFHEHHQPNLAKRFKAMKGAANLIGERGGLLFGEVEKAVGARSDKIASLRNAKSQAEAAFKLPDA